MKKIKKKKSKGNGRSKQVPQQVKDAMQQLKLTLPQALHLLQEMKVVNLQLKVANNALVGEIKRTFDEMGARIEELEKKMFGEIQGDPVDITGPSTEAMTLPTEQAKKDAALLKKIQEADKEEPAASSTPLGEPVGEPDDEEPPKLPPTPGSMFPRS